MVTKVQPLSASSLNAKLPSKEITLTGKVKKIINSFDLKKTAQYFCVFLSFSACFLATYTFASFVFSGNVPLGFGFFTPIEYGMISISSMGIAIILKRKRDLEQKAQLIVQEDKIIKK